MGMLLNEINRSDVQKSISLNSILTKHLKTKQRIVHYFAIFLLKIDCHSEKNGILCR